MDLWQDVKYATRRLVEAKWFTAAAVIALSLGIGANTTVFTFVNAVLLRGLPFEDPDRIMAVFMENARGQRRGLSLPDSRDVMEESRTLERLALYQSSTVNLSDEGQPPERADGVYVTGNFFRMVGEQPVLGRDLTDADDLPGADPVVLIGHGIWENRYEADPGVLGTPVRVNSLLATIVGVMGPDMRFPNNNDLWIPQALLPEASNTEDRGSRPFAGIGRLAPDASIEQAREELRTIGRRLEEAYPDSNAELGMGLMAYSEEVNGSEIRLVFLSLMGAVAFVLLIACGNVANLLLARSAERGREIAVRVALGATRRRIVRQLLVESLLVAVLAALVGLGLSWLGIRWFDSVTQNVGKPYWMVFSLDGIVFVFMAGVCVGTAVLFGLAPALHVSRTDVNEVLKEGTRGGSGGLRTRRWSGALMVGQMVLTLVLLSGSAFMMRSFMTLYSLDPGVDSEGLLTMQVYLPLTKYPEPDGQLDVFDDLLDRLGDVPAIEASALATALPVRGGALMSVELDGRALEPGATAPTTTMVAVSEGYFETIRVEPIRGRTLTREDGVRGSDVALVNRRFVDVHLGGGEGLGRTIRLGGATEDDPDGGWTTVVGVTPDIRQRDIEEREADPVAYVPLRSRPTRSPALMLRSQGTPAEVTTLARDVMRRVEPDVPLSDIMTFDERLAEERWPFRVFGTLFTVFAGIALTLSAVGLYSITAHSVVQRVREFGIRVSLGAEPREISRLALQRVLRQLAIGLPIGMIGAAAVGRLLQSLLVQQSPTDPLTLAGVLIVMVAVAVGACLRPARRAGRIDPVTALRVE